MSRSALRRLLIRAKRFDRTYWFVEGLVGGAFLLTLAALLALLGHTKPALVPFGLGFCWVAATLICGALGLKEVSTPRKGRLWRALLATFLVAFVAFPVAVVLWVLLAA